jgi:OOP family OmpA-OmpF porin
MRLSRAPQPLLHPSRGIRMTKPLRLSGIAAALAGLGLASGASQAGVFFGGTAGRSSIDDYEFGAGDINQQQDDSDTAWNLFLGYQWNPFLATTIGYTDLGELTASGTSIDGGEGGGSTDYTDKISATALNITAIGILPFSTFTSADSFLGRFSLFAELGIAFWDQDVNCVACDGGSNFKGGDTGSELLLGGGLNLRITDSLGVHVRYASYPDIGGTRHRPQAGLGLLGHRRQLVHQVIRVPLRSRCRAWFPGC